MRIALVTWLDAVAEEASDTDRPASAQVATLTEVGFLLDESATAIQIGMESEDVAGITHAGRWRLSIPRQNIRTLHIVDQSRAFPKKTLVWQAG